MNANQINSGMLAMLKISNYGNPLKDPGRCLRLKTTALISSDRTFDILTRGSKFKKVDEMKLVDILARELKVWPENLGEAVGQCSIGYLHNENEGVNDPVIHSDEKYTRSEDWFNEVVTRAEWQAAVEALKAEQAAELHPAERAVEWDGSSLPPVGIECEIKKEKHWHKVKILAHLVDDPRFNPIAIYMEKDNPSALVGQAVASRFRPTRTKEQIAAQDREKAIEEMILLDEKGSLSRTHFCGLLYDAGYARKQVAK